MHGESLNQVAKQIKYTEGYKYQLSEDCLVWIDIRPERACLSNYISLATDGLLIIFRGYAWDGASGPAIDTKNFRRGSLIHDALYQLLREGFLPESAREQADKELRKVCLEDGMSRLRAWWVYHAVRRFGSPAADPKNKRKVLTAP